MSTHTYLHTYTLISNVCCVFGQKLRRRIRTFGVDFQRHLEVTHCNIPIIVTKCINELDERGLWVNIKYQFSMLVISTV